MAAAVRTRVTTWSRSAMALTRYPMAVENPAKRRSGLLVGHEEALQVVVLDVGFDAHHLVAMLGEGLVGVAQVMAAPRLRKPQLASTQIVAALIPACIASRAASSGFLSDRPAWAEVGLAQVASRVTSSSWRLGFSGSVVVDRGERCGDVRREDGTVVAAQPASAACKRLIRSIRASGE